MKEIIRLAAVLLVSFVFAIVVTSEAAAWHPDPCVGQTGYGRVTCQKIRDANAEYHRNLEHFQRQVWATPIHYPTRTPRPVFRPDREATHAAWQVWHATMVAESEDWVRREQATLQVQHRGTMAAQPTATAKPTATPLPPQWDVEVLAVVEHYEEVVAAAGYAIYGLIEGEQWLALKLRVASRLSFPNMPAFNLDTGNGRHNVPGNCVLTIHPEERARLAGLIAPLYPKLLAYHGLPFQVQPGEVAEGWVCFTVRDGDVPNARLVAYRGVWSLAG